MISILHPPSPPATPLPSHPNGKKNSLLERSNIYGFYILINNELNAFPKIPTSKIISFKTNLIYLLGDCDVAI